MYEAELWTMNSRRIQRPSRTNKSKFLQYFTLNQMQKARIAEIGTLLLKFLIRIFDFFIEICTNCSIHGLKHFVTPKRHFSERIFWILMEIVAFYGMLYTMSTVLVRFDNSPTVISMERDYLSWNTSFPAATFCLRDLNASKIGETSRLLKVRETKQLRSFMIMLANLTMYNLDDHNLTDHPSVPPYRYVQLLNTIQASFVPQILTSLENDIPVKKTMTEVGLCYAINSEIAVYNSPHCVDLKIPDRENIMISTMPELTVKTVTATLLYWSSKNWSLVKQSSLSGHQLDGELFVQLSNFNLSYHIYFHEPRETPQMTDRKLTGRRLSFRAIVMKVLSIYSTPSVRGLSFIQRKCRFLEDRVLDRSPIYTYNLCLSECRAKKILHMCGCLPHFYRPLTNERICSISELSCVKHIIPLLSMIYRRKAQDTLSSLGDGVCTCAPSCDGDIFTIHEDQLMQWDRWTQVKFGIKNYPKMRLKRDVMFGITDVLIRCGGAAGLFFGASVLTAVELVYFILARLSSVREWLVNASTIHL